MNRENQYSMPLLATYIREIYSQLPFDMNLISSDRKKVPVHYIVMAISSKILRKMLSADKFKLGLEGEQLKILTDSINRFYELKSIPFYVNAVKIKARHNVLEKAVNFLYDRNVHIPRKMEDEIKKVFEELDVYDRKSIDETLKQQQLSDCDADFRVFEDFPQVGVGKLNVKISNEVQIIHTSMIFLEYFIKELHKESDNRRLQWVCRGKDCKVECVTKLVDGQMMINKRKQVHSSACNQQWARPTESKANRPSKTDDDDDDTSYKKHVLLNGDPAALHHIKQQIAAEGKKLMPCKFPGCKGGIVLKEINGKMMGKEAEEKHSPACMKKSKK